MNITDYDKIDNFLHLIHYVPEEHIRTILHRNVKNKNNILKTNYRGDNISIILVLTNDKNTMKVETKVNLPNGLMYKEIGQISISMNGDINTMQKGSYFYNNKLLYVRTPNKTTYYNKVAKGYSSNPIDWTDDMVKAL